MPNIDKEIKLEKCPHCGAGAKIAGNGKEFWIACRFCGCRTASSPAFLDEWLVNIWNLRAGKEDKK